MRQRLQIHDTLRQKEKFMNEEKFYQLLALLEKIDARLKALEIKVFDTPPPTPKD